MKSPPAAWSACSTLTSGSFDLGGLRVDYRQASVRPEAGALAAGRYDAVRGTLALDGTLKAETVRIPRRQQRRRGPS